MKLHQSQLFTIKFHIYPRHPSECWSSMFSQHFHYNIKPKLRAFGKLRELESFIKINVWKGSMGDLSKYKNLNKKNEKVLRARKEVRTMAGWSYSISQEIIYSCFFFWQPAVPGLLFFWISNLLLLQRDLVSSIPFSLGKIIWNFKNGS